MRVSEWALDRINEAFEEVGKDEARKLSTVQEIMTRSTDFLWRIIAPAGEQGGVTMSYLCPYCNSFPMEDCVLWVSGRKKRTNRWSAISGEKHDCKQPNSLLAVQTGESVNQAKVFRAHSVPQGLCGNLIDALKLLVNQEEDGDGLTQNIVTNLGEGSRKGLTEGLREYIQVDNHRALEVGHLNEGLGTLKVRRPKGQERYPEVTVRESPDELTLRAEEVGTWKSYINAAHSAKERWGPPLVDADWHAFCHALYKGTVGEDWGELYDAYTQMSRAVGVKKPQEAWEMKAAKDAGEECCDAVREDDILGNKTRLALWEEHLKDPIVALDNALKCVENSY